jgi:hypothetical protein
MFAKTGSGRWRATLTSSRAFRCNSITRLGCGFGERYRLGQLPRCHCLDQDGNDASNLVQYSTPESYAPRDLAHAGFIGEVSQFQRVRTIAIASLARYSHARLYRQFSRSLGVSHTVPSHERIVNAFSETGVIPGLSASDKFLIG